MQRKTEKWIPAGVYPREGGDQNDERARGAQEEKKLPREQKKG
jgi:hypothetical protein